jgi:hypothetical protein
MKIMLLEVITTFVGTWLGIVIDIGLLQATKAVSPRTESSVLKFSISAQYPFSSPAATAI